MVVIGIESVQSWDFAVIKKKRHESQEGFFLPQVTENLKQINSHTKEFTDSGNENSG